MNSKRFCEKGICDLQHDAGLRLCGVELKRIRDLGRKKRSDLLFPQ